MWLGFLAAACAGGVAAVYLCLRPDVAPEAAAGPDLSGGVAVVLAPDRQTIPAGGHPTLTVTLVNRGSAPLTLVMPRDGSDHGLLSPAVEWLGGDVQPVLGRCGISEPLRADEVFTLGPGEVRSLDAALARWVRRPRFGRPGTYHVAFAYTNAPASAGPVRATTPNDPDAIARARRGNWVRAVSNTVEVVVEGE